MTREDDGESASSSHHILPGVSVDDLCFDALTRRLTSRRAVAGALTGLSAALAAPAVIPAKKHKRKVTLCLDGQTLHVPRRRRKGLLRKGAQPGACATTTATTSTTITTPACVPLGGACSDGGAACCTNVGADADCTASICRAPEYCVATLIVAGCTEGLTPTAWSCTSLDLTGLNLNGCDLTFATFANSNLTNATFVSANLTNVNFPSANVTGVTWGNTTCPKDAVNSDDNGNTCCGQFLNGQAPATGCSG